ncbi:MAG: hypothetical protein WCT99_12820, partial [Bacteroidota bacterium]
MMNTEKQYSDNRIRKVAVVTAAIAVPIFILASFEDLFIILVVSFTLTFVLKPSVDYIENLGAARWLAIAIVFTGLGSIVTALLFLVLPEVTKQITHISTAFSKEQLTFML